jgi:hypothetical protein
MSDPTGYIACSVIGPDTAAAMSWLRRQQAWDHRLDELHDPAADRPEPKRQPPAAA